MPRSAHGKHGRHGKKTGRRVEKERPRTAKADQLAKAWVVRNLAEKNRPIWSGWSLSEKRSAEGGGGTGAFAGWR